MKSKRLMRFCGRCVHTCVRAEEECGIALRSGKDIFNQWEVLERAMTEGHSHSYTDLKMPVIRGLQRLL